MWPVVRLQRLRPRDVSSYTQQTIKLEIKAELEEDSSFHEEEPSEDPLAVDEVQGEVSTRQNTVNDDRVSLLKEEELEDENIFTASHGDSLPTADDSSWDEKKIKMEYEEMSCCEDRDPLAPDVKLPSVKLENTNNDPGVKNMEVRGEAYAREQQELDCNTLQDENSDLEATPVTATVPEYFCTVCDKQYASYNSLYNHLRTNAHLVREGKPVKQYQCEGCGKVLTSKQWFNIHRESKCNLIKAFKFGKCLKIFTTLKPLKHHNAGNCSLEGRVERMICPKQYKCLRCGRRCSFKSRLQVHMDSKCKTVKLFQCDKCLKQFASKYSLRVHIESQCGTVSLYKCGKCNKEFTWKGKWKQHLQSDCNSFMFKCSTCNKSYKCKYQLLDHIKTECGTLKLYRCDKCGKDFARKRYLTGHCKTSCGTDRLFKCTQCSKEFFSNSGLSRHAKTKCGSVNPFPCEVCGKRFSSTQYLMEHTESQCGTRKHFECEKCNKKFEMKNSLKSHLLHHCGASKQFKCEHCSRKFTSPGVVKAHLKFNRCPGLKHQV